MQDITLHSLNPTLQIRIPTGLEVPATETLSIMERPLFNAMERPTPHLAHIDRNKVNEEKKDDIIWNVA